MSLSMSMSLSAALPAELMAEILCRLPVKTLLQIRCVSKLWRRFIDSSYFIETHRHRYRENQFLLLSITSSEIVKFLSLEHAFLPETGVVLQNPLECRRVDRRSRRHLAREYKCRFPSLPDHLQIIAFMCLRWPRQGLTQVWGTCNGLVLISNWFSTCLRNPSTRKHLNLPRLDLHLSYWHHVDLYGFGYDSACGDYKVIKMILMNNDQGLDQVWVYTPRSNLWRKLTSITSFPRSMKRDRQPGVFVQEALHWHVKVKSESDDNDMILAFDFKTEDYRMYSKPKCRNAEFHSKLGAMNGMLCLIFSYLPLGFDIWVMREVGVEESWTRVTLEPGDFVSYPGGFIAAILRDGDKVMLHNGGMCSKIDTNEGSFRKIICSISDHSDVCVVSLVSPDGGDSISQQNEEAMML